MRVCFFAERQVGIGSVAAILERHVRGRAGDDVTWCDITYYKSGGWIEGIPLVPRGAKAALRSILETRAGLRAGPFDALFFLTHNPAVLQQRELKRTPACVWTDVTPIQLDRLASAYDHQVTGSVIVRAAKHAAVRRTFHLARRCLGWSDWARQSFVHDYGVAESRAAVVPPAIDASAWQAPRRTADPSKPLRLAFVGGHFERKGGKILLEVFRRHFRGQCELSIATRDPVPEEAGVRVYRGLAAGSDDLRRLLFEADAFVLPTLADCHSIASLEAMAAGLPVVLTRVGAGAEIVDDQKSGFLVDKGDPTGLAHAIQTLVSDRGRAAAMGAIGRATVLREFDAPVMVERIFGHIRSIVDAERRGGATPGRG